MYIQPASCKHVCENRMEILLLLGPTTSGKSHFLAITRGLIFLPPDPRTAAANLSWDPFTWGLYLLVHWCSRMGSHHFGDLWMYFYSCKSILVPLIPHPQVT